MSQQYREVRKAVFNEATCPFSGDPAGHFANKQLLQGLVQKASAEADLNRYRGTDRETAVAIWHHLWTKNRYAGIRSQIATTEIRDIECIFDDFERFSSREWDIETSGHNLVTGGSQVHAFLNRTGEFRNKQTIGNLPKLVNIVSVARQLKNFLDAKSPDTPILQFITSGTGRGDVWPIHARLLVMGYRSDLTVLHFMMDIGFQVIKPDIVISRFLLDRGWFHKIIPGLPRDLAFEDLQGKGSYGQRYAYTNARMYRPAIDLARAIAHATTQDDLKGDIGWVTGNPIRELDLFLVKYGQKPEREAGIARTLFTSAAPASMNCISARAH